MNLDQPLPREWMVTDERQGAGLLSAIARMPHGSGIVFRHYQLDGAARRRLFREIREQTRERGILVLLAGAPELASQWDAHGSYGKHSGAVVAPVHDLAELRQAERNGAALLFVSPVFTTRSHPGVAPLGKTGLARFVRQTELPVVALGGMDAARTKRLAGTGIYGWAGIDAWRV